MKAKIKATGEIVEVYHEPQHGTSKMIYKENVLVNARMFTEDELDLLNENNDDKHWQDVRERAAIAAMQGLLASPSRKGCFRYYAETAIEYADALVEELKKK